MYKLQETKYYLRCYDFCIAELLGSQTELMKSSPHELRDKGLAALHAALISNSGHLLKLGLLGVQVQIQ